MIKNCTELFVQNVPVHVGSAFASNEKLCAEGGMFLDR
jgi:hypothetical protein